MRQKIVLLRLERGQSGIGMYGSIDGDEPPAYAVFGEDAPNHKPPHKDKKLRKAAMNAGTDLSDYFYAFKNEDQLLRWCCWDEWLMGLHERDVVVSEYVCNKEDVLVGSYQVCFKQSISKKIFSITEYFEVNLIKA